MSIEAPARSIFTDTWDDPEKPELVEEEEEEPLNQSDSSLFSEAEDRRAREEAQPTPDPDAQRNAIKAAAAAALQGDKRQIAQLVRRVFTRTYDQLKDDYHMEELAALATTAKRLNAEVAGVVKEMHDELAQPIKDARKG